MTIHQPVTHFAVSNQHAARIYVEGAKFHSLTDDQRAIYLKIHSRPGLSVIEYAELMPVVDGKAFPPKKINDFLAQTNTGREMVVMGLVATPPVGRAPEWKKALHGVDEMLGSSLASNVPVRKPEELEFLTDQNKQDLENMAPEDKKRVTQFYENLKASFGYRWVSRHTINTLVRQQIDMVFEIVNENGEYRALLAKATDPVAA